MPIISHFSWAVVLFKIVAWILQIKYGFSDLLLLIFSSTLPDFDFFFHRIVRKKGLDSDFRHHEWPTHWPLVYSPVILIAIIFPSLRTILICFGCFLHFVMDSFFTADGIMWLAPISKKSFLFCGKETMGNYHGWDWFKRYRKLWIYKLDIVLAFIAIIILFLSI